MQAETGLSTAQAITRAWKGLKATLFDMSPVPGPVVDWEPLPRPFERARGRLRTDLGVGFASLLAFAITAAVMIDWDGWAVLSGALAVLPVVATRRRLLLGWRVMFALSVTLGVGWSHVQGLAILAVLSLSGFTLAVALSHSRTVSLWAWVLAWPVVSVLLHAELAVIAILGGVLALLTDTLRSRRLGSSALATERERVGVERARRIGVEERARVARELHDVVAHHMSTVAVRAETAPYRLAGLTDEVKAELAAISDAARESLNEIRGLLGVLRSDEAPRVPQPGLDQLEALIETTRRAGGEVDLAVRGEPRPLRAALELSAYRILQESLSNVSRHAPGQSAEVWVEYGEEELGIVVANPCVTSVAEPGHGLTGMTERAAAVGGVVDARRRPDGRFVVEARLPVEP